MPNLHNIDSCPEHWKQHKNMGVLGFAIYITTKPVQKRSLRIEEPLFRVEEFVIKKSKEGMIVAKNKNVRRLFFFDCY